MTQDDIPAGEMKYSFKLHATAHGYAGDLIISATTLNDLVTSIKLLPVAGFEQVRGNTPADDGLHSRGREIINVQPF